MHSATGAPVLIHKDDLELYSNLEMQANWLGVATPAVMSIQDFVKEGDTVRWGGYAARVLHTPGHTPGSISLVVECSSNAPSPGLADLHGTHEHAHVHTPATKRPLDSVSYTHLQIKTIIGIGPLVEQALS